jgi:hypothetical protein
VYNFLATAGAKYGVGFWKPGSGIIHQVCYLWLLNAWSLWSIYIERVTVHHVSWLKKIEWYTYRITFYTEVVTGRHAVLDYKIDKKV